MTPCRLSLLLASFVALTLGCKAKHSDSGVKDLGDESNITNNNNGTWTAKCKNGTVETMNQATYEAFEFCPQFVKSQRYFNAGLFDFATVTTDLMGDFASHANTQGYNLQGSQFAFFKNPRAYGIQLTPVYFCQKTIPLGNGFMTSLSATCESAGNTIFGDEPIGYLIPVNAVTQVQAKVTGLNLVTVKRCFATPQNRNRHLTTTSNNNECGPTLGFPSADGGQPVGVGVTNQGN